MGGILLIMSNRIVLVNKKKPNQLYHICKYTRSGTPFDILGIVNDGKITEFTLNPLCSTVEAIKFKVNFDLKLSNYTEKQYNKRNNKEDDIVLHLDGCNKFKNPILVDKKVRGNRLATKNEIEQIELAIINYLAGYKKFYFREILYNTPRFQESSVQRDHQNNHHMLFLLPV